MDRKDILKYEGSSRRVNYEIDSREHSQAGFIYSVTKKVVVFWPFEHDVEIAIPFSKIISIIDL